jgi:hypothetical protein
MELEELKAVWSGLDRKLDANLRLNRKLLTAACLDGARSALQRLIVALAIEGLIWLLLAVLLGSFVSRHISMPRFALPGALLDLYLIGNLIAVIKQITLTAQIDYAQPVAVIQKQLQALRVQRLRTIQWSLLAGILAWTPLIVIVLKACFDLDSYTVLDRGWLVANVIFSILFVGLAIGLSRKYAHRVGRYPVVQQLMNELAGYSLNSAANHLAEIAEFEEESVGG